MSIRAAVESSFSVGDSLVQVFSRVGVFWGVLWMFPETRTAQLDFVRIPGYPPLALGIASMYFCWSVRAADETAWSLKYLVSRTLCLLPRSVPAAARR